MYPCHPSVFMRIPGEQKYLMTGTMVPPLLSGILTTTSFLYVAEMDLLTERLRKRDANGMPVCTLCLKAPTNDIPLKSAGAAELLGIVVQNAR